MKTVSILGLGLIGGSLAKTIKRKMPKVTIYAADTNASYLNKAISEGIIDKGFSSLDKDFLSCDLIFLCGPVDVNIAALRKIKDALPENPPIITDVSSMKTKIHKAAEDSNLGRFFIGGHPMAGLESSGYDNANSYLFENVYYIITPSPEADDEKVSVFEKFLEDLDIIPIRLDVKAHDFSTACVSHVPHIISAALVNLVKDNDKDDILKTIAAGGFKDITRISSSSPDMWTLISKGNKDEIVPVLEDYIEALKSIIASIQRESTQEIHDFFSSAKAYRDDISNNTGGVLPTIYQLSCEVIDEEGEIATIATRLATHHISIKNISIVHNREFEQGALNIEFYDRVSLNKAAELLEKYRYTIYLRS